MTANTEDILQRIRAFTADAKVPAVKKDFVPPRREDFRKGRILTFDQSLSKTGWAVVNTHREDVVVEWSGTLVPPSLDGLKGFDATFTKSVILSRSLRELLLRIYKWVDNDVVVELPAVTGYRTESSLIAAVTICTTLDEIGGLLPTFVSRQAAGAVLCGDRHASKNRSSELVNWLVEGRHPTETGCWTEHARDAVFVGLRHLHERAS